MQPTATANDLSLRITQEIRVQAPLEVTFDALLEELGPSHQVAADRPLPMKLEARPGGRWGHVQVIKPPTLLEIWGPLFMSFAAVSNLQYRLTPIEGGTLITFVHSAMGLIPDDVRTGMGSGWTYSHERIKKTAERVARK